MVIRTVFSRLSLFKQRIYCNIENAVYIKNERDIPDTHPRIELEYKIISNINELSVYLYDIQINKNKEKFIYFLKHGCKMYLTLNQGVVTGFFWVSKLSNFKPYIYNNNILFDCDNVYYIFFCHTFKKYRRKGIYSYILTQICRNTLTKPGRVMISADIGNIASQKGIEKAGFIRIGIIKCNQIRYKNLLINL